MINTPRLPASQDSSRLVTLISAVIIIGALYFGKDVFMPLALAVLLTFLLAPLVRRLETRVPRIAAVVIVVMLALTVIGGLGWIVTNQFVDLAKKLPSYKENIRKKLTVLKPQPGAFTEARETFRELSAEISQEETSATAQISTGTVTTTEPAPAHLTAFNRETTAAKEIPVASGGDPRSDIQSAEPGAPVPVEVVSSRQSYMSVIRGVIGPILNPLATAGIVIIFVIFMLIQLDDLRDRFIRLTGQRRINVTTKAMDEAACRVSRYLLMQVIVNVTYGIPVAAGLYFIGVPNAMLWGILATLLRFIPYLGPWMAAVIPILLSLAVFDGWTKPALTISIFIILEVVSNNFLEPWLYGTRTGVSPVAVIVSAVFWTWLWGGVGLFLATPLTVCLVVIGRYVPQLAFLSILFGDEPVLSPGAKFYQRLVAMDHEQAIEMAEKQLEESSLKDTYDNLLIPAISLAEEDRHKDVLDEPRHLFVRRVMEELVEEFGDRARQAKAEKERNYTPATADAVSRMPQRCIVCMPARDEADQIAAEMLAQLLEIEGKCAKAVSISALAGEVLEIVQQENAAVVVISALPPLAVTHARYLCKRLRAKFPELIIVVGLWNAQGDTSRAVARIRSAGTENIVTTLAEAMEMI